MVQAQKIERLAVVCRSIHPDDVVDNDSDDLMNRIEKISQAVNKQQKEQDRLSQEINTLFKQAHTLMSKIEARKAFKKRQQLTQTITIRIPFKSRRKLLRTA